MKHYNIISYAGKMFLLKGRVIGFVTHLRLTYCRFFVLCVRINHFGAHVMVSREVDSKVLRVAIELKKHL